MAQIRIFQSETYPLELQKIRSCLLEFSESTKKEVLETDYLNDYASSKMWDINSEFGKIHNKLMTVLEDYSIIAYHNTRLADPSKIICNGLIFSDERYIQSLREDMLQQEIPQEMMGICSKCTFGTYCMRSACSDIAWSSVILILLQLRQQSVYFSCKIYDLCSNFLPSRSGCRRKICKFHCP